jgi:hypothetical protein
LDLLLLVADPCQDTHFACATATNVTEEMMIAGRIYIFTKKDIFQHLDVHTSPSTISFSASYILTTSFLCT